MEFRLSPSFEHSKLEDPTFEDLIDVYEDLWVSYIFTPAENLLESDSGGIAARALLSSYFEAIESYITGEKSESQSKKFFIRGFCKVFNSTDAGIETVARHFYKYIRCGLAHEGLLSQKVCYSYLGCKPIFATYPNDKLGEIILNKGLTSIIINPRLIFKSIDIHFKKYISDLRSKNDQLLCKNFEKSIKRQIGDVSSELIVGMTEDEFIGKA